MLNITLTLTAAPELLAAMSSFTSAITAAKVVTIPEYTLDFTTHSASKEKAAAATSYNPPSSVPVNNPGTSSPDYPAATQQQASIQIPQVQNQVPVQTAQAQATSVPTTAPTYTMEQLAVAATQIVDAGRRTELVSLLSSFGVQALTALPKEQYGSFATSLRALGAKIDNLCVQGRNTAGAKIDNLCVQQRNTAGAKI